MIFFEDKMQNKSKHYFPIVMELEFIMLNVKMRPPAILLMDEMLNVKTRPLMVIRGGGGVGLSQRLR